MAPRLCTFTAILMISMALAAGASRSAHADAAADRATADALFHDARQLMAHGRTSEACPIFEASLALVRRLGVLLNLAVCYEETGRTASAWALFNEAVLMAQDAANAEREAFAREHVATLTPRLRRLVVVVADDAAGGVEVRRDGTIVPPSLYGVGVPIDPGEHRVEASAPGRLAWSATVSAIHDGEVVRVEIPTLAPTPVPPRAGGTAPPRSRSVGSQTAAASAPRHRARFRSLATWLSAGAGVVGCGVGTYFGLSARSTWKRVEPECGDGLCSAAARAETLRARRLGQASTAAFAAGGAALATGLVLYLTTRDRSSEPRRSARITPAATPGMVVITVDGTF